VTAASGPAAPDVDHRRDATRAAGVALLALALRLALFVGGSSNAARFVQTDSRTYLNLGHHFDPSYIDATGSFVRESVIRTPAYPALISAVYSLGGGMHALVALQIVLGSLNVVLVYYAALRLRGPGAALVASLLLALDVPSILFADYVMSETLFASFLLVGATFAMRFELGAAGRRRLVIAAAALGLATLVRPITLYLPILLVLAFLFTSGAARRARIRSALLAVAVFAIPVGGWIVRNTVVASYVGLSPIDAINLLDYRAAGALSADEGTPLEAARAQLHRRLSADGHTDLTSPALRVSEIAGSAAAEQSLAFHTLLHHPGGSAVMFLKGLRSLLLESAKGEVAANVDRPSVRHLIAPIGALDYLVTALTYVGAFLSLVAIRRGLTAAAVPLSVAAYLVILSAGPEAYARFRVPLMPLLTICAGVGYAWGHARLNDRTAR
jgi:4-amino-4-deoxy-L-arabinose transferase-like glycosyltransferase